MIMSDLPQDLVEEILSRVPAISSKRLLSTCKRWNALFEDQRFIEKHFRKSASPSMALMLKELKVFSMSASLNVADPSIEFKVPLGLNDSHSDLEQVHIFHVFHCGGLLLCHTNIFDRLLVWNPCLGKTRWIKTDYKRHSRFALGYENNKCCPRFKILRCYEQNLKFAGDSEIYEFSSDSWRVLDVVALDCNIKSNGVALKGNAYWPAIDSTDHSSKFLLSFDFTREKFRRMCLPTFQNPGYDRNMSISVVREEQLAVLLHQSLNNTPMMEIWVTNKIDTEAALSWSKSFTACLPIHGYDFYFSTSFLIDEEKKVAVCCYTGLVRNTGLASCIIDKYTKMALVETTHVPWIPFIYSYVPSLVQIQCLQKKSKT